jgi:hypothetical protein
MSGRARVLFCKKNQKTFLIWAAPRAAGTAKKTRVFASFCKKKRLL